MYPYSDEDEEEDIEFEEIIELDDDENESESFNEDEADTDGEAATSEGMANIFFMYQIESVCLLPRSDVPQRGMRKLCPAK